MDEAHQIKHNYTREYSGPNDKTYTLRKDPKHSFWTIWRGAYQYPGQFTSLPKARNGILNIINTSKKAKKKDATTVRDSSTK